MKNKMVIGCCLGLIISMVFISGCIQTANQGQTTDSSLKMVKERGKLIVGISATYPPMEFKDESGAIIGLDADLAKEIASEMGISPELVDYEWDVLFDAVKSGEVDIAISSITINSERSEMFLFSTPYFNGGQVMLIRNDTDNVKTYEDLATNKVGVQRDTTCEPAARKYTKPENLKFYNDSVYEIDDLLDRKIDIVVIDYVAAVGFVNENPSLEIIGEPFTQEFYGIMTNMDNSALMDEIDRAIRNIKERGKLVELDNKWLG